MGIRKIKPVIEDYLAKVGRKIRIKKAILYGSYARGKAKEFSDVDLLVISDDFSKMNNDERLKILYRLSVGFPYDLHVNGITPQEYKNASLLTSLGVAKKTGIIVS